ncbi:MAG: YidC/Oxa1 family membrane protein insertase [Clostridia bacterium]|nr:YidC/Oxa1 family membrane protein insertase [Clostridia bacterium]
MKKLSPIKRSISLAMLMLIMLMLVGMIGTAVAADDTTAPATDTAAATDTAGPADTKAADSEAEKAAELEKAADTVAAQIANQQSGFWHTLSIPFGYVVRGCSIVCGGHYAFTLILYALAMKILLFPFGIKQQKNSIKQAKLRPKEQAIREKYAGRTDRATQQKVQMEIQELYQREHFSPFAGCLPMLLQLPIIFALYRVVYNPLYHVVGLATDKITQISGNLIRSGLWTSPTVRGDIDVLGSLTKLTPEQYSAAVRNITDVAQNDLPKVSLFGLDLAASPTQGGSFWYYLIPILVFVSSYLSMKLMRKFSYQPTQNGDAGKSLKIMDFAMPALSAFFAIQFPALLGLYWIYQSLLGVLQQIILYKMYPLPQFTEEDYAAARREILGKGENKKKKPSGPRKYNPKSLHHIDDDDFDGGEDEDSEEEKRPTLLNGEKLPEQKGAVPPAAMKEDVPAPEKKKKDK